MRVKMTQKTLYAKTALFRPYGMPIIRLHAMNFPQPEEMMDELESIVAEANNKAEMMIVKRVIEEHISAVVRPDLLCLVRDEKTSLSDYASPLLAQIEQKGKALMKIQKPSAFSLDTCLSEQNAQIYDALTNENIINLRKLFPDRKILPQKYLKHFKKSFNYMWDHVVRGTVGLQLSYGVFGAVLAREVIGVETFQEHIDIVFAGIFEGAVMGAILGGSVVEYYRQSSFKDPKQIFDGVDRAKKQLQYLDEKFIEVFPKRIS